MAVNITELSDDWVLAKVSYAIDTSTTVEKDVVAGPCTLYFAHVAPSTDADEEGGAVGNVYFKLWDHANPTHGTDEPEEVFPLKTYFDDPEYHITDTPIPINPSAGLEFETGLSLALSGADGPGKTAGTSVKSAVDIILLIKKGG